MAARVKSCLAPLGCVLQLSLGLGAVARMKEPPALAAKPQYGFSRQSKWLAVNRSELATVKRHGCDHGVAQEEKAAGSSGEGNILTNWGQLWHSRRTPCLNGCSCSVGTRHLGWGV
ncbi:UNVERIFIED_CONTAM: hypothetical protein K2H54_025509 [Gekko kuhli]